MNARHITCAAIWALCLGAPAFAGFNEGDSIGPSGLELLVVAAFGVVAAPLGFLLTFFGAERVYKVLMWLLALCLPALFATGVALQGSFAVILVGMAVALLLPALGCLYLGALAGRALRQRRGAS